MRIYFDKTHENLLKLIGTLFIKENESIYVVGGAIRDLIRNIASKDFDFVSSASPKRIRKIIKPIAKAVYDKSPAKGYGTQGVVLEDGLELEITPFRRFIAPEFEAAAASPSTSVSAEKALTLEEDLKSRDFTINAIAVDISPERFGEIIDPYGGISDLDKKILRTPRPAAETFSDDPLRVLRAVRFSVQFGLSPDPEIPLAVEHILKRTGFLDRVAPERVRDELNKLILLEMPSRGFRLMYEWGLMNYWLPEAAALAALEPEPGARHKNVFEHTMTVLDRAADTGPREAPFLFAALLHDAGKPAARRLSENGYIFHDHEKLGAEVAVEICKRLRFSGEETERVAQLVLKHHRLSAYRPDWTDSAVRRALNDLGGRYEEILALTRADLTTSLPEKLEEAEMRLDNFTGRLAGFEIEEVLNPRPPIDGYEIMRLLGITPGVSGGGADVGAAAKYLKDMIVAGELDSEDAETARRMITERKWEKRG